MCSSNCCFLTCIQVSQEAGQVVWYSHLLKNFPEFVMIYKKAKWLSEKALQIAVKRREARSKGEKERYTHLNVEFQRTARRDKKVFLSDQCKKIEETNSIGKIRDLYKEVRDIKGTFQAKMSSTKARNGMDLREAEYIKKRWQEYNCTKKIFMTHIIMMVWSLT